MDPQFTGGRSYVFSMDFIAMYAGLRIGTRFGASERREDFYDPHPFMSEL